MGDKQSKPMRTLLKEEETKKRETLVADSNNMQDPKNKKKGVDRSTLVSMLVLFLVGVYALGLLADKEGGEIDNNLTDSIVEELLKYHTGKRQK